MSMMDVVRPCPPQESPSIITYHRGTLLVPHVARVGINLPPERDKSIKFFTIAEECGKFPRVIR